MTKASCKLGIGNTWFVVKLKKENKEILIEFRGKNRKNDIKSTHLTVESGFEVITEQCIQLRTGIT